MKDQFTCLHPECHAARKARKRVFAWLPTPVYSSGWFRDGFRWLRFVWRGDDGRYYTSN